MTLIGEREEYITTQETQWLGSRAGSEKSRVWEFQCEHPNGSNGSGKKQLAMRPMRPSS